MKTLALALALLWTVPAFAADLTYEGTWVTTKNRKLDGTMTSIVKDQGNDRWKGRFFGIWQGVSFDYTVDFIGKPDNLKGTAVIDGADYTWTGKLDPQSPGTFKGSFTGSRYTGSFDLKSKTK